MMIRYVPSTPEAIHPGDTHCFSMNMSSDEQDVFVIWWMRRLKKKVTRRQYWGSHFNRSGELGSVIDTEPDQDSERFRSFYTQ
jgi:hypothetical protein